MDILTIILILAGTIVLVFTGGGIFAYFMFAVPAMPEADRGENEVRP